MIVNCSGILMLTWESQSLRRTMQETVSCMMEIIRTLGTILRTRWTSSSWPTWPGTGARPSSSGIGGSALSSPSCLSSWSTHLSTSYLTFQSAGKLGKIKELIFDVDETPFVGGTTGSWMLLFAMEGAPFWVFTPWGTSVWRPTIGGVCMRSLPTGGRSRGFLVSFLPMGGLSSLGTLCQVLSAGLPLFVSSLGSSSLSSIPSI